MHSPIFKHVFGDSWNNLPDVIKKHYANRPYSSDEVVVEGYLDVYCRWFLKLFFWLFRAVPPYSKLKVPVTVVFKSEQDSKAFCFKRIFYFEPNKPFYFHSKMFQVKDNEVIEMMNCSICWHCIYSWNANKVLLEHKGYSFRFFKFNIPLPITYLIGAINAEETPIDDDNFSMCMNINHWLFGKIYEYKGQFKFTKEL